MKSFQSFFRDLGLQRKLLLVSVFTTLAAMLVALFALASYDVLVARPRVLRDMSNRSELLALNFDADLNAVDRNGAQRKLDALRASPEVSNACLYTADSRLLAHFNRDPSHHCSWPQDLAQSGHSFDGYTLSLLSPVRFERETVGYLALEYQLPSTLERMRRYGLVLGVIFLTVSFGGILYAWSSRRLVTAPLLALSAVADQVTREQRYDLRSPVASQDEVGRLAGAFNGMLATIAARDAALRRNQALLNNIVEKSSAVIYVKDLEGRYLMVNHSFRMLLPPGSPEPLGNTDEELFSPEMAQACARPTAPYWPAGAHRAMRRLPPALSAAPGLTFPKNSR
jgi:HAMP domain-containing protein